MIVAIDGPAGSGKSTTARAVAAALGYTYLDTGAMYRAVALAFLRAGAAPEAAEAARIVSALRIEIAYQGDEMRVLLGGEDVSAAVRAPEVGAMASRVSRLAAVREKLVAEQRRIARERVRAGGGVVLDGRDIGTVVFPEADLKIFMVADAHERARRRHDELRRRGDDVSFEGVLGEIQQRDQQDRERTLAPLRPASDAVELDTTDLGIEEQVRFVVQRLRERLNTSEV